MSNKTPDVGQIVEMWLKENGYDGLYNDEWDCGCAVGDINHCEEISNNCTPGYHQDAEGSEYDYVIGPKQKPRT